MPDYPGVASSLTGPPASLRADDFDFVPVRVVDVEGPHVLQHRVHAVTHLHPLLEEGRLERVVLAMIDAEREVVQRPLLLLAMRRKVGVRMRVWDEHDHFRNPAGRRHPQEFVGQRWGRDDLHPEHVAIELQRRLHVGDPQHDLRQTFDSAHAAIASRFKSRTRGGTEQPGASNKPRPPVSSAARSASALTFDGGPYTSVPRWLRPPITARAAISRPCASDGLPWLCTDQLIACVGRSRARVKLRFEPHRWRTLNHAASGIEFSTAWSYGSTISR